MIETNTMLMPWSSIMCVLILAGALVVTALNVFVVGGFVGRATTVHPDLENVKGRQASKNVIALNSIIASIFLVLLILYAGSIGWKSYGSYAMSKGCDLSSKPDSFSDAP